MWSDWSKRLQTVKPYMVPTLLLVAFVALLIGVYAFLKQPPKTPVTFQIADKFSILHMDGWQYLFYDADGNSYPVSQDDYNQYDIGDDYTVVP